MDNYLQTFLAKDTLPEQKEIRQQIAKCFEEVGCFLLPHPGKRVARTAKYAGEVSDIDPAFRQWVNVYIQRLFRERLRLKKYGVGSLTASDLFAYMSEFAQIFQDVSVPLLCAHVGVLGSPATTLSPSSLNTFPTPTLRWQPRQRA